MAHRPGVEALIAAWLWSSHASAGTVTLGESPRFALDPATLAVSVDQVSVNAPQAVRAVAEPRRDGREVRWTWPALEMEVRARLDDGDLVFDFSTPRAQSLSWYSLPTTLSHVSLALGEGSRFATTDPSWRRYLAAELGTVDTNWDLKLPLWSTGSGGAVFTWILETPFANEVRFADRSGRVQMAALHHFDRFNQTTPFRVRLHVGPGWLSGALRYRRWLQAQGQWESLEAKLARMPAGRALIGATHVYLWGDRVLDREDVRDWPGLLRWLRSHEGAGWRRGFSPEQRASLGTDPPSAWQQRQIIGGLDAALREQLPLTATPEDPELLAEQAERARRMRRRAETRLGAWTAPSAQCGQGLSLPVLDRLAEAGLSRLWIGIPSWTALFLRPEAVAGARQLGYLVAGYDSYDTAIAPGVNDDWLTAQMPRALAERCAIWRSDGTPQPGFGGKGSYLNPGCVLAWSQERMRRLVRESGVNSLFLDVDGTGMARNDHNPRHPDGAGAMVAARVQRLQWVSDALALPLGSEDGNAVASRPLLFAHGLQTWGFGWSDAEMRRDKGSPYYLGGWWPPEEPGLFFKPTKLKALYRETVFKPRDRLPLYQAVFHDSVINSHHWQTDSLKFGEVVAERALLNLLYNTPPLFNLSRATLGDRLPAMRRLDAAFRPLHEALWNQALVGFRWLDEAGLVQETRFGDGSRIVANFGAEVVPVDGEPLTGKSLRARLADGREMLFVFTDAAALRSARGVTRASRRSQSAARRRGNATLRAPDVGAGEDSSRRARARPAGPRPGRHGLDHHAPATPGSNRPRKPASCFAALSLMGAHRESPGPGTPSRCPRERPGNVGRRTGFGSGSR